MLVVVLKRITNNDKNNYRTEQRNDKKLIFRHTSSLYDGSGWSSNWPVYCNYSVVDGVFCRLINKSKLTETAVWVDVLGNVLI